VSGNRKVSRTGYSAQAGSGVRSGAEAASTQCPPVPSRRPAGTPARPLHQYARERDLRARSGAMHVLSRITHFQSLVIGLFDGLPAGTSPCAVENTGSGTGSEASVTRMNGLVRLPTGGLDSSSPRQAQACHRARRRQGRPGNVVVCGTVRATADLDGVCARRRWAPGRGEGTASGSNKGTDRKQPLCQFFVITIREGRPRVSCSIIPAHPSSPHQLPWSGLRSGLR
jgi:hypothetical protein